MHFAVLVYPLEYSYSAEDHRLLRLVTSRVIHCGVCGHQEIMLIEVPKDMVLGVVALADAQS